MLLCIVVTCVGGMAGMYAMLAMIVDAPEDFGWHAAMDKLAALPRQAEWEAFVARLQKCDPNARSDEKWKMMTRMFYLYD